MTDLRGLDGAPAFDVAKLANLVPPERLTALADSSASLVHALAAVGFARAGTDAAKAKRGTIARWEENAAAIAHVEIGGVPQVWAWKELAFELAQSIEFDQGPHSVTRTRLRVLLRADASGTDDSKRAQAMRILRLLDEKGVLMAVAR
jgi:hypothetical protein